MATTASVCRSCKAVANSPEDWLCAAAMAGHKRCMAGASAQGAANFMTAMCDAAEFGHVDCAEWAACRYTAALREAAENGHWDWGSRGFLKALRAAAKGGHAACMKWAKQRGAKRFEAAMYDAAEYGHTDCIDLAAEWGARDFDEALRRAAISGEAESVKRMIHWGAIALTDALDTCLARWNSIKLDEEGREVARGNRVECVRHLVAHGATIDLELAVRQVVHGHQVIAANCDAMFAVLTARASTREIQALKSYAAAQKQGSDPAPHVGRMQRCLSAIVDRRAHQIMFGAYTAMFPLELPIYVVHWILEWVEPLGMTAAQRIRLLEGVRTSIHNVKSGTRLASKKSRRKAIV